MWIIPLVLFWKHVVSLQNETIQRVFLLGAITNGDSRQEDTNEIFSFNRYSARITWRHVDMNEPFQILKAVRHFDTQSDIDAMVLLNYDNMNPVLGQITASMKKPVIRWSDKPPGYRQQNVKIRCQRPLEEEELCKGEDNLTVIIANDTSGCIDLNVSATFNSSNVSTFTVSLHAPCVMMSVINTLRWKHVIIIYENFTAKETDMLIDLLTANEVLFIMFNIDKGELIEGLLQVYKLSLTTGVSLNFMVLCRLSCARRTLKQAAEHDKTNTAKNTVLKEISQWLIATYGISTDVSIDLKSCADDLYNVAVFSIPELQGKNDKDLRAVMVSMLYDLQKPGGADIGKNLTSKAVDYLKAKSEVWNNPVNYTGLKIETLLWIQPKGRDFSPVGYIDLAGNVAIYSDIFPNTKYKFNNRKLIVSTLEYYPFVVKTTEPNGTVKYGGLCINLLDELAVTLNFTYKLVEPPDGIFGIKGSDGMWNGLVGQLERQEVDMVVAALAIQPERGEVMDFTFPFYYDYTTVLLKKPDPDKYKWKTLIEPFQWQVLVSICASLPVISFLVFIMEKYNPYYDHPEHHEAREVNGGLHSFAAALWYMYGALFCQGGTRLPDSLTGRTMISFWGLFSIVVVGTYCGNLIAFLTVPINKPPFNTIKELAELKDQWKWGTQGGTYWEFYFQTSKTKEFRDIGKGIKDFNTSDPSVLATSVDSHVEKVRSGAYALIVDKTFIEIVIAKECSMMKIKEEFLPLKYAIGLPKNSPYTRIVSDEVEVDSLEKNVFYCQCRLAWYALCLRFALPEVCMINVCVSDTRSAQYRLISGICSIRGMPLANNGFDFLKFVGTVLAIFVVVIPCSQPGYCAYTRVAFFRFGNGDGGLNQVYVPENTRRLQDLFERLMSKALFIWPLLGLY